jgi:hypothetical protein
MGRVSHIWTNFRTGAVTPLLGGRPDMDLFLSGCGILKNYLVLPHGGVTRRPGTRFIAEVKNSTKATRIIPFIFNEEQAYILEIGDQYIRFFYDQGQLLSGSGSELVTNGTFEADTDWTKGTGWTIDAVNKWAECDGTQVADSDLEQSIVVTTGAEYSVKFTVSNYAAGSITPILGGTDGTARSANGRYEEIIVAGAGGKIEFRADVDFEGYIDLASVKIKGILEITSPYTEDQLDQIRVEQSADVMYFAHPDVEPYKLSRTFHTDWSMDALGVANQPADWAENDWPSCVCFYEQRLWFAATASRPQTLWASKSGDYEDFDLGAGADDDGLEYTISNAYVNRIQWIVAHKVLMVGTVGSEWTCGASSILDPITPTNVRFTRESTVGSNSTQARLIHHAIVFLGQHGRKCWELRYSYEQDGYSASDISIHAEHLAQEGLGRFDYQQDPLSVVWSVRDDGDLVACSYNRVENVIAWHHHDTQGTFEDAAVIPGADRDEVWVLAQREVDGTDYRFVELMQAPFGLGGGPSAIEDAFFVDSGLSYSGVAKSTFSGLDHLEGEEVTILADGSPHPSQTVVGGSITLDWDAEDVHAGLPFTPILETMPIEAGGQDGVAQGKQKRLPQIVVRVANTVGLKIGTTSDNVTDLIQRKTADYMDSPVPLYTGDKQHTMKSGWERDGRVYITQNAPLPSTILAIIAQVTTEDITAQGN